MFSQSFPTHRTGCPKKTWTLFGAILVSLSANPSVKGFFGTPCSKDYIQFLSFF